MKITPPSDIGTATAPEAQREEIKRLAQQFEALLLTQMIREMRRSMIDDGGGEGFGSDVLIDNADIEIGSALSRGGGLGVAGQMLDVFERQIALLEQRADGPPGGMDSRVTAAVTASTSSLVAPPVLPLDGSPGSPASAVRPDDIAGPAPVSSAFGWRRDPLTGSARFHAGVDIAIAYGREVRSAAGGVVSFAGTQAGYGHTVVVDHGNGRQTRYAHLSEPLVKAGDRVAEGQVVGKSGSSGRSTGPHLHFEMLVNGQPVDPLGDQT